MFEVLFQRTQTEREDSIRPIKSMSYNCPGHKDRLKVHCERVQRDYFDSGLFYKEMHSAQGGSVAEVVMVRLVGWEVIND